MKAYEFSTTITPDGKLELPDHLKNLSRIPKIRVIVLVEEPSDIQSDLPDEDDTPTEEIAASLHRAQHEAKTEQTKPIAQLRDSIDSPINQLPQKRDVECSIPILKEWLERTDPTPPEFDPDQARWEALKEKYNLEDLD